jgi:RND superfamily putative drug exporter
VSTVLYRVGRFAYRFRVRVVVIWAIVLVGVVGLLALNPPQTSSQLSIPGTPSQQVMDHLDDVMPSASGTSAQITFKAPAGERVDSPDSAKAIAGALDQVHESQYVMKADAGGQQKVSAEMQKALAPVGDVTLAPLTVGSGAQAQVVPGVTVSGNGKVALATIQLTEDPSVMPSGATDQIVDAANTAQSAGVTVLPGEQLAKSMPSVAGPQEGLSLLIAAIVLFLTLGSLRLAGLPLLTAIVGVGAGVGGAFALSNVIPMTSATPTLALMLGLAVGIDYALFLVNKARTLILDKGLSASEATARAIGTAGSAVFFAGLTVLVALCGLSIVGIGFLTTMALVAAGTVAVAVLVALTLLPAILGFVGERLVTAKQREKRAAKQAAATDGAAQGTAVRWARFTVRRRGWITATVVVLLGVVAIPMTHMTLNLPSASTANLDTTQRQAYDATTAGFGEGFNGPLLVVADSDTPFTASTIADAKTALAGLDHVSEVIPGGLSSAGTTATFTVVPDAGPDADSTVDLVHALRDSSLDQKTGLDIGVTGVTAINIDMSKTLSGALLPYLATIVVISLVILLLVFRSLFVPVTATLGFVLTIGATLGATTAVFQWGWLKGLLGFDTPGPILNFLPVIVTGILYGLAMDYQVFLVSSMRESHVHGHRGREGVVDGFRTSSRVIVAAAIIMVSVFAGFIFGGDPTIMQIGFALAFGILVDAFLVRMTLIPAVMALAGDKAWWLPKWLDRFLPNLDVEGDKLVARLEAEADADAAGGEDAELLGAAR